jgi:hypothetical protein
VPAESGAQVIGGLEMLGDQRRVLIQRIRVALFDRGCQAPMQLDAVGLQLSDATTQVERRDFIPSSP